MEADKLSILDLQKVYLTRDKRRILSDLSWVIRKGQHWSLIGPNGSGKTTLLQIINGYLWPSEGTASVLGNPFGSYDLREMRKSIGLVSSFISEKIPAELTALDIVLSGYSSSLGMFEKYSRLQVKRAKSTLESIGCGPLSRNPYGTLSDGEKQKVLIARALMSSPKLLTLDEPCSRLDIAAREAFLQLLTKMLKSKHGPTIIFATHRIEEIVPTFTHTMIISGGRVVASGIKSRVLTSRNLTKAFGTRVRVIKHAGRYHAF